MESWNLAAFPIPMELFHMEILPSPTSISIGIKRILNLVAFNIHRLEKELREEALSSLSWPKGSSLWVLELWSPTFWERYLENHTVWNPEVLMISQGPKVLAHPHHGEIFRDAGLWCCPPVVTLEGLNFLESHFKARCLLSGKWDLMFGVHLGAVNTIKFLLLLVQWGVIQPWGTVTCYFCFLLGWQERQQV